MHITETWFNGNLPAIWAVGCRVGFCVTQSCYNLTIQMLHVNTWHTDRRTGEEMEQTANWGEIRASNDYKLWDSILRLCSLLHRLVAPSSTSIPAEIKFFIRCTAWARQCVSLKEGHGIGNRTEVVREDCILKYYLEDLAFKRLMLCHWPSCMDIKLALALREYLR